MEKTGLGTSSQRPLDKALRPRATATYRSKRGPPGQGSASSSPAVPNRGALLHEQAGTQTL